MNKVREILKSIDLLWETKENHMKSREDIFEIRSALFNNLKELEVLDKSILRKILELDIELEDLIINLQGEI